VAENDREHLALLIQRPA